MFTILFLIEKLKYYIAVVVEILCLTNSLIELVAKMHSYNKNYCTLIKRIFK